MREQAGPGAIPKPADDKTDRGIEARAEAIRLALCQLEAEQRARLERLRQTERKLAEAGRRKLADAGRRAIRQIEIDRQRVGRDLHTGVGQMLAAIRLQVEILDAQIPTRPEAAQEALNRISAIADGALEQVRAISRRWYPLAWQRLTLDAALRRLCELTGIGAAFETELRLQPLDFDPGVEVKSLFYRAAQEGLSNVIRHSRATRIQIILQPVRDRLVLQVRDNGVGFDTSPGRAAEACAATPATGLGLESIREEARLLGGKLLIQSSRTGTTLEISVRVYRSCA